MTNESRARWALLVPQHLTKHIKTALEGAHLLDKDVKILEYAPHPHSSLADTAWKAIPLRCSRPEVYRWLAHCEPVNGEEDIYGPIQASELALSLTPERAFYLAALKSENLQKSKSARLSTPLQSLQVEIQSIIDNIPALSNADDPEFKRLILDSLPTKWEKYDGFILLPETAFLGPAWDIFFTHLSTMPPLASSFFSLVARSLSATHLARKARISADDVLRRPHIVPLFGDWGCAADLARNIEFTSVYWAHTVQNSINYTWSPQHTMFSAGNITEKHRVSISPLFACQDAVVVDLYAGIGYFTFPFLIHQHARVVHACEWNPWSVEALRRGAELNGIPWRRAGVKTDDRDDGRLIIYEGDNAQAIGYFEDTAQQVNLGLLPSSEAGWPLAVRALDRRTGGWLHVHENILAGGEEEWKTRLEETLRRMFEGLRGKGMRWAVKIVNMEKVKSFAPRVNHWVADVECRPSAL